MAAGLAGPRPLHSSLPVGSGPLPPQWHNLSREEQAKYYELARKERQLHSQLYPTWSARDNYVSGRSVLRAASAGGGGKVAEHTVRVPKARGVCVSLAIRKACYSLTRSTRAWIWCPEGRLKFVPLPFEMNSASGSMNPGSVSCVLALAVRVSSQRFLTWCSETDICTSGDTSAYSLK